MPEVALLIIAVLLIIACGVFVAAEFSLITVNRNKVEKQAAKGDRNAAGVLSALRSLSTQLSGAQVGITITNLAIGLLAESAIASLLEGPLISAGISETAVPGIAVALGITLATIFTMLFGELVPKNLAIARPIGTAKRVQALQRGFSALMKGPIRVLNNSANYLLRRIGVEPQEELATARSAEELASLVRRSAEQGTLPKETAIMLERTLVFDELTAYDVMTPRINIYAVHDNDPVDEILSLARTTGLSRFPVITTDLDHTVGIVHLKHVFAVPSKERRETPAKDIMRPPILVPSSVPLDSLLRTLRKGGLQIAMVIDEFGGTDGLVTIEDVLEEIVDEVRDEHDSAAKAVRRRKDGSWVLSGLLRPDEIAEEIGIFLPDEEDFDTIGGLINDRLKRLPNKGDSVLVDAVNRKGETLHIRLNVQRIDKHRVDRVLMRIIKTKSSGEGAKS